LNDYRKRSRSTEDVGGAKSKMAKVHTEEGYRLAANGFGNGNGYGNGYSQGSVVGNKIAVPGAKHMEADSTSMPPESQEVQEDDPMVYGKFDLLKFHVIKH
jgi:transcription initiation factor TFIIE subunit alpha